MKGGRTVTHRPERAASVIKRCVAVIIENEISDPRIHGVSVVDCEVSRDLKTARIFVDIEGDDKAVLEALTGCTSYIRKLLAEQINEMRVVPQIRFEMDRSRSYYEHIDKVIKEIHRENNND